MVARAVVAMITVGAAGQAAAADAMSAVDYGRYLVEGVGLCDDCHTPRDASGHPDPARRLQGAEIGFKPTGPVPSWADKAPPIAGGPVGWTRLQMVEFLTTGTNPGGSHARLPMPPYRLTRADAEAVAVYLESLPRQDPSPTKVRAR